MNIKKKSPDVAAGQTLAHPPEAFFHINKAFWAFAGYLLC